MLFRGVASSWSRGVQGSLSNLTRLPRFEVYKAACDRGWATWATCTTYSVHDQLQLSKFGFTICFALAQTRHAMAMAHGSWPMAHGLVIRSVDSQDSKSPGVGQLLHAE